MKVDLMAYMQSAMWSCNTPHQLQSKQKQLFVFVKCLKTAFVVNWRNVSKLNWIELS